MLTDTTSKHVLGTTELTCLIPMRTGFVAGTLDTRTFATRARIAMRLLHTLRLTAREVLAVRPVPDSVDAITGIYSFAFYMLQNRQLLLSVSFDKPWEAYMRVVWKRLGPVLDLVLCNCEGYDLPAYDQGFERFVAWIRERQQESEFFYATGRLTVDDQRYLMATDSIVRETCDNDFALYRHVTPEPARIAADVRADPAHGGETARQYAALLSVLFGLRDLYPSKDDGRFLHGAARLLMDGFSESLLTPQQRGLLKHELDWFASLKFNERPLAHRAPPSNEEIQGGILKHYAQVTHGCLLLFRVTEAAQARAFLSQLTVTTAAHRSLGADEPAVRNIAFTHAGLKRLGVSEVDLGHFPKEFREGMQARAGLLGDVRGNHPDNWVWPVENYPPDKPTGPPVHLSTIDFVITLRAIRRDDDRYEWSSAHPLYREVQQLAAADGVSLLAVEPLRHYRDPEHRNLPREHFGFVDGISQPLPPGTKERGARWDDSVPLGDLLLGYANGRHDPPFPPAGEASRLGQWQQGSMLDNGTFLVVRKLRQHVDRLEKVLNDAGATSRAQREALLARMAGRTLDGRALADSSNGPELNDFNYEDDSTGVKCPFQAHIRRANPRTPNMPRIARRGMTYGPRVTNDTVRENRGVMFMAYNASIAEQFEVIQRWMTGGNSTGVFSGHTDPFLRVPDPDQSSTMRFAEGNEADGYEVSRVDLQDKQLVSLEWGLYLFVPSIVALRTIAGDPSRDPQLAAAQVRLGLQVMSTLKTTDDWSTVLEDLTSNRAGITSATHAAIRAVHGGVLRTPYGIIGTNQAAFDQVLADDSRYSVHEYMTRLKQSVGAGYLGLDDGPEYRRSSEIPNAIVGAVSRRAAFEVAHRITTAVLKQVMARLGQPATVKLDLLVDQALAELCGLWFGVPEGEAGKSDGKIKRGGKPITPDDPNVYLPFHSLAPSRYVFSSPNVRPSVATLGQTHGAKLLTAVREFVDRERQYPDRLKLEGSLLPQLFTAILDRDELARTIVGMLEGFLPTVFGNMLKILNLWLTDETLWRVQQALLSPGPRDELFDRAMASVYPEQVSAMMVRPVPDLIYRTAVRAGTLGSVQVEPGDTVVLAISSVTEASAAQGLRNVAPIFGGLRAKEPHPTHACPAYEMGLGVILGMLTAVLQVGTIRPTPFAMTVVIVSKG